MFRRYVASAGLVALLLSATGCLPNPQSVKERRESFDRDALKGSLLFDAPPSNMRKVESVFDDRIQLMGYTLDPAEPKKGDTVVVTFFWTALKPINEDYMVFVHGDAIGGNARRLHGDHYPAKGKYPTDVWRVGDIVADPFEVKISSDYGAPRLGINTGMYKGNYRVPRTSKGLVYGDGENRTRPVEIVFP